MSAALTVSLDERLLARMEGLAAEQGSSRDALIDAAMAEFILARDTLDVPLSDWQLREIEEGLAAADRGDLASEDEVERVFAAWRA